MDDDIEDIHNARALNMSRRTFSSSMAFWRKMLLFAADGVVYLNNTLELTGVDMTDWARKIQYDVEDKGEYDQVLQELIEKYKDRMKMSPEISLALGLGTSFGFAHAECRASCTSGSARCVTATSATHSGSRCREYIQFPRR
ncbi:uncharacterized protein BJ171DRAFT_542370 [Polychytrium aggregatum]|uniref:uncharacterized protein n=1 Tax=Polychytrium aggregatum TaxID=110093 RepID=UPI0022FF08D0|nr:uncharacterized protein BJ171DRAFT_542370 [Polychytrium aggregatum]KAI9190671.1 hypothetical protein BJ171DRAFT_542370 [Polychytrium aggregatum]